MSDDRPHLDITRPGTLIVTDLITGVFGTPDGEPVAHGVPVVVVLAGKGYVGASEQQARIQLVLRPPDAENTAVQLTELLQRNGIMAPTDHRCLSSCYVTPGVLKRCALPAGHLVKPEVGSYHQWVEATRSDGRAMVARWKDADAQQPDEVLEAQRRNDL